MDNYLSGIGDDGCCSEGIDYWYYGFSFYIHFAEMLYRFTDGKEDIRHLEKVENLVEFQQNMIMRNNTVVSFSDGKMEQHFIHIGLFNYLKQHYPNFKVPKMDICNKEAAQNMYGGNHSVTRAKPSWLIRDMLWSDANLKSDDILKNDYKYYDKTQWYINKKEKYSFAAKAGHNEEEHNHNDVGTFIIATDKGQIISDLGAMEYTKKYFDPVERYTVFNASSFGHSVPIIDGQGQLFGKNHCAENVIANENIFVMDIDGAYDDLGVKITRKFDIKENSIILTDEYKCDDFENHKITERFISVIKPELLQDGVKIGDVFIKTSNAVNIEKLVENNHQLEPMDIYTLDIDVTESVFQIEFEV